MSAANKGYCHAHAPKNGYFAYGSRRTTKNSGYSLLPSTYGELLRESALRLNCVTSFAQSLRSCWRDEQMHMIRHRHVRMQQTAKLLARRTQLFSKKVIVISHTKNLFSVVTPQNNMLRLIGYDETRKSCHCFLLK